MLFKPSEEQYLFKSMFRSRPKQLAQIAIEEPSSIESEREVLTDIEANPIKEKEKNTRYEKLEEIIRAVKLKKDAHLNNKFDTVIDLKAPDISRRCDTDFSPQKPPLLLQELESDSETVHNMSFPGLNNEFDENEKRMQMLKYFERRAVLDAQREREIIAMLAKEQREEDSDVKYDAELIDNCFFASKSKADNVAQTIAQFRDQGLDPIEEFEAQNEMKEEKEEILEEPESESEQISTPEDSSESEVEELPIAIKLELIDQATQSDVIEEL
jgi:hypothetical protein